MPDHGKTDSKSGVFESWPYTAGSQNRQNNQHRLLIPARASNESESSDARRSTSIPLPSSHVHRTQSELQLDQDQEVADQRDTTMFYRLVNGIRQRHQGIQDEQLSQSERSLQRIIHTRLSAEQEDQARSMDAHHFHFQQQQRHGVMVNHISPIAESFPHGTDEWSITGFNEQPVALDPQSLDYVVQLEQPDAMDSDTEIFALDP